MATEGERFLGLKEIIELFIKHFDLHEGLYDLGLEMQIGVGNFGPTKERTFPGAAIGIAGLKLVESKFPGAHTVDAAKCNPEARQAGRRPSKKSPSR